MKRQIKYIELKTGYSDNGPAWIGFVESSKTGQTLYFNDIAFKKAKVTGGNSNYYDIETGDEYWISGVKKNQQDRHWAGNGKIMIDKSAVAEYLKLIGQDTIDMSRTKLVDIKKTDKTRIQKIENTILTNEQYNENCRQYWDKGTKKFEMN